MAEENGPTSGMSGRSSGSDFDALSDVLDQLQLNGVLLFMVDATDPWCVEVPPAREFAPLFAAPRRRVVSFHVVIDGAGTASVPEGLSVPFQAGDVLVIPRGDGYRMESAPGTPPEFDREEMFAFFRALAADELPFVVQEGGGGQPPARFVCGFLTVEDVPFDPFLSRLPALLKVRRMRPESDTLSRLVDTTIGEFQRTSPGTGSMRRSLCRLLLVETLRQHLIEKGEAGQDWLGALADAVVGKALRALHGEPSAPWTLDRLAAHAGVSRSVLAERFAKRVGHPPMDYLVRWRMQIAGSLLTRRSLSIDQAAAEVGYSSAQSFSRAFKRVTGVPPAEWRRAGGKPASGSTQMA